MHVHNILVSLIIGLGIIVIMTHLLVFVDLSVLAICVLDIVIYPYECKRVIAMDYAAIRNNIMCVLDRFENSEVHYFKLFGSVTMITCVSDKFTFYGDVRRPWFEFIILYTLKAYTYANRLNI